MNSIMITLKINMVTTQDYRSQILIVSCMKLKLKMTIKIIATIKKMFDVSDYSTKSKYYDNSNKLVAAKMKDETILVEIEEFVGLKPKMYSYLVDDNSECKKAKGVNKNAVVIISHNEYKCVMLNKKCLRYLMNRIQNKDHRIGTCQIIKIFLCCFDDKIYIQNNGYDGLALSY